MSKRLNTRIYTDSMFQRFAMRERAYENATFIIHGYSVYDTRAYGDDVTILLQKGEEFFKLNAVYLDHRENIRKLNKDSDLLSTTFHIFHTKHTVVIPVTDTPQGFKVYHDTDLIIHAGDATTFTLQNHCVIEMETTENDTYPIEIKTKEDQEYLMTGRFDMFVPLPDVKKAEDYLKTNQ